MKKAKLLVIDDDPAILSAVSEYMQMEGHTVFRAPDLKSAYEVLENNLMDVVITDFELPDGDALEFLGVIKRMNAPTQCIVMTGYGTIDLAVKAIKEGAEQFATKPVQFSLLSTYVNGCLLSQQNKRKQLARALTIQRYEKNPFQGTSTLIRQLEEEINKFAQSERPILIQGETGTGKGVLAEWIHKKGQRAEEA
ncbi:MAG TPA: response regulator, partial [Candidatus Angelobacter sp.]